MFRCVYLGLLLVSLVVMYEAQRPYIRTATEYALFARSFAYTLIIVQDLLVAFLVPVYLASAIAEERENQTLEALFLVPLSDSEIVYGKFASRMLHLGAVILAGLPLLAFMHMWGNVPLSLLTYHFANTLLFAMTAGSLCMNVSIRSTTVIEAITSSYPIVLAALLLTELPAFMLPEISRPISGDNTPFYAVCLLFLIAGHVLVTHFLLGQSLQAMKTLRKYNTRPKQKAKASFSLGDGEVRRVKMHKGKMIGSNIHPLALPIPDTALWWKECLKDGSRWSLTFRWALRFFEYVLASSLICNGLIALAGRSENATNDVRELFATFAYCAYSIALAAYFLVVLFQTTYAVAAEREQGTLEFLLMLPTSRREIFWTKWIGPLWRNWPILAVSYLGAVLGFGMGFYSPGRLLVLLMLPWPMLMMCSFLAMWMSVACRRVLLANIITVAFVGILLVAHFVASGYLADLYAWYTHLIFNNFYNPFAGELSTQGLLLVVGEQLVFCFVALGFGYLAYTRFLATDYQSKK